MALRMKTKPAAKKPAVKKKPASRPRTTPRVTNTEDNKGSVSKNVEHRQNESSLMSMARDLGSGEVLISGQLSELVPVAQYASVTLGPVMLAWKLGNTDMSVLADVDWDDEDTPLTDEQQAVYDRVRNSMRSTGRIIEEVLAEDRETVERSVRMHNEREAEAAAKKPARRSSK